MNAYRRIRDFHADRLRGLGSSDMPILAGMTKRYENDYTLVKTGEVIRLPSTPLTLHRVKKGRIVQIDNEAKGDGRAPKRWGNRLEPLILMDYVDGRYGPELAQEFYRNATRADPVSTGALKVKTEAWHPKILGSVSREPFCYAHADLLDLTGEPLIVEAKSAGLMSAKRREGDSIFRGWDDDDRSNQGVPDPVTVQIMWQAYCYDIREAIVKPLIDTSDLRTYGPLIYDSALISNLLALAERFWWHVEHDKEPQPTTWDDVVSLNPTMSDTTAIVGGDEEMKVREMIAEAKRLKATNKANDEKVEDIKDALGILAGANKYLGTADGTPLAKISDRSRESVGRPAMDGEDPDDVPGFLKECQILRKKRVELTPEEKNKLDIEDRLRAAGLVKVSQWREVRY